MRLLAEMKILISLLTVCIAVYLMNSYFGDQFDQEAVRDQRVLITGASSGIGEQLAYQYAKLGARLVITARRASLLRNVTKTCENLGAHQVSFLSANMDDPEDRRKVIEHVEKHLGGLDHLVLNHALMWHGWWLGSAENFTYLEAAYLVNFLSYVDLTSKALPMLTKSRGRIGVVSSGFGEIGTVLVGVYSSAKYALNGFFASLREEMRLKNTGVSVTVAVLGPISSDTMVNFTTDLVPHLPLGFMATPSSAAQAILKGVTQRRYSIYNDWKTRVLSNFRAMCPVFTEDSLAESIVNTGGTWFSSIIFQAGSALS